MEPSGKPYGSLAPAPITNVVGVLIKTCPRWPSALPRPPQSPSRAAIASQGDRISRGVRASCLRDDRLPQRTATRGGTGAVRETKTISVRALLTYLEARSLST